MKLFLISITLLVSLNCVAQQQKDYYINAQKDTIYGKLGGVKSKFLKFTSDGTHTSAKILAAEIVKAYNVKKSTTYISAFKAGSKNNALPTIHSSKSSGPIFLVEEIRTFSPAAAGPGMSMGASASTSELYLIKDGIDTVMHINSNALFGSTSKEKFEKLKHLLADDQISIGKIEADRNQKISAKELRALVADYNERNFRKK